MNKDQRIDLVDVYVHLVLESCTLNRVISSFRELEVRSIYIDVFCKRLVSESRFSSIFESILSIDLPSQQLWIMPNIFFADFKRKNSSYPLLLILPNFTSTFKEINHDVYKGYIVSFPLEGKQEMERMYTATHYQKFRVSHGKGKEA